MKDKYEQYLIDNNIKYKKDFIPIVYWDDDGEEKIFLIDFCVELGGGLVEWVQVVPHQDLRPIKKYLYAKKISESHGVVFRGLNKKESSMVSK